MSLRGSTNKTDGLAAYNRNREQFATGIQSLPSQAFCALETVQPTGSSSGVSGSGIQAP